MKNIFSPLVLLFNLIAIPTNLYADEIKLNNGDQISGSIMRIQQDTLVLHSPVFGKLEMPLISVISFKTEQPMSVIFNNEDKLTGLLSMKRGGILQLQTERLGIINNINISDLASAHQPYTKSDSSNAVTKPSISIKPKSNEITITMDEVFLKSGDRLLGTIQGIDENNLIIQTEFADTLTIDRQKIKSFSTFDPMTVVFNDHDYITGRIKQSNRSQLQVNSDRAGTNNNFKLAEVKKIIRGDPIEIARAKEKAQFSGDVDIGLSTSSGNSDDDSYVGSGELRARTPNNRYSVRIERAFERSDGDKTKDETFGSIQYDHFLSDKWYLFNSASFKEDEIELLNLRTALSAGVGYQFFERDDLLLSAELGPSYVNEDFKEESDSDYLASRWAIDYEHKIFEWMNIFHHQEGLYGLETSNDVVIRARNGLKFPLGNGFNAKAQANYEWDKSPADGADSTDKEYIFTLGYGF